MSCDECGRELYVGDRVYDVNLKLTRGKNFCSCQCAKDYLISKADELIDEVSEEGTVEAEDEYVRYGLSRADF